jgi:hypothetical protein
LGDIVLPGLLLAFGARFDATSQSMLQQRNHHNSNGLLARYFVNRHWVLLMIGYAIGLGMANMAVYVMNTGQPALLYLVPCTLGVLTIYTKYDGTFDEMWLGINTGLSGTCCDDGGGKVGFDLNDNGDDVHDRDDINISDHTFLPRGAAADKEDEKYRQRLTVTRSSSNSTGGYGGINRAVTVGNHEGDDDDDDDPMAVVEL